MDCIPIGGSKRARIWKAKAAPVQLETAVYF